MGTDGANEAICTTGFGCPQMFGLLVEGWVRLALTLEQQYHRSEFR